MGLCGSGSLFTLCQVNVTNVTPVCLCVCVCRKSETERRSSLIQQNKDGELVKKVQQLESEKQAVDVCVIQLSDLTGC